MKNSSDQPRKVVLLDFTPKEKSDIQTLMRFVEIYCKKNILKIKLHLPLIRYTNLDSKIERGGKKEMTETHILVRRVLDDEGNKVI